MVSVRVVVPVLERICVDSPERRTHRNDLRLELVYRLLGNPKMEGDAMTRPIISILCLLLYAAVIVAVWWTAQVGR